MPIHDDVTKIIGNTPLVRINRIIETPEGATIAAKVEGANPANSVKDRIGAAIIDAAQLERLADPLKKSGYGQYLLQVMNEQVF